MKARIILVLLGTILSYISKSQQIEKYLKLNNIILIDSVKIISTSGPTTTIFKVTVPQGVYWKIENLTFNCGPDAVSGIYHLLKINNAYLPQIKNEIVENTGAYPSWNGGFSRISTLWVGPNTTIQAEVVASGTPKINLKYNLIISAHEFFLE